MSLFSAFQIWDLADPDGKGYLDKQVGNKPQHIDRKRVVLEHG